MKVAANVVNTVAKSLSMGWLIALVLGFFSNHAQAVCPVCTVAVTTGVGLSRWLGVDDLIAGLWLGGLVVSLIIWTLGWMAKRSIHFRGETVIITATYYLLAFIPLYLADVLGHPGNKLMGFDKLVLGALIGSIAFYGGAWWYERIKSVHKGHAYFPFQKIVMPIMPLAVLSILFYLILQKAE